MILTRTLANHLTAALLVLALVALGFGHRHSPATPADPGLAAYVAMGGVLDDLCLDEQEAPQGVAQDCPVCTLAKVMALAPETARAGFSLRPVTADLPPAGHLLASHHTPRAPPARGPPAALV